MRVYVSVEPSAADIAYKVKICVVRNELGGFIEQEIDVVAQCSRDAERIAMLRAVVTHDDCLSVEVRGCVAVLGPQGEDNDK